MSKQTSFHRRRRKPNRASRELGPKAPKPPVAWWRGMAKPSDAPKDEKR